MEFTTSSSFQSIRQLLARIQIRRNLVFGIIIIGALLAFEIFNYSTTDYALTDLLGNLEFAGLRWATILSIAFCGIDFAGIARLFTPEEGGSKDVHESWYLFGAWMLAATMNAILTWWGVSMAVMSHSVQSNGVIDAASVSKIVPVFVALMVWVIRILIIGSLSYNSSLIFAAQTDRPRRTVNTQPAATMPARTLSTPASTPRAPAYTPVVTSSAPVSQASFSAPTPAAPIRPAPKPAPRSESPFTRPDAMTNRPEPTYHTVAAAAPRNGGGETHQF